MIRMFVRHQVNDYDAWRKVYDGSAPFRQANIVQAEAVYRSVDDPQDVTVTHDFATLEAARAFVESSGLKELMQSAGVAGEPMIWVTQ